VGKERVGEIHVGEVDLMNDLVGILIKVRYGNYLVMSDVKKAFLQIKFSSVNDRNKILHSVEGRRKVSSLSL